MVAYEVLYNCIYRFNIYKYKGKVHHVFYRYLKHSLSYVPKRALYAEVPSSLREVVEDILKVKAEYRKDNQGQCAPYEWIRDVLCSRYTEEELAMGINFIRKRLTTSLDTPENSQTFRPWKDKLNIAIF